MKDDMKEKVANFILDFQARNRQARDAREAEIIQTEQIRSVMRGASALVEANIPREQSVFLLKNTGIYGQVRLKKLFGKLKTELKRVDLI